MMVYSRWSWKLMSAVVKHGRGAVWRALWLAARYSEAQPGSPVTHLYSFRQARRLFRGFHIVELRKAQLPYRAYRWRRSDQSGHRWVARALQRFGPSLEPLIGWHTLLVVRPEP